jgi:hypothetical protein
VDAAGYEVLLGEWTAAAVAAHSHFAASTADVVVIGGGLTAHRRLRSRQRWQKTILTEAGRPRRINADIGVVLQPGVVQNSTPLPVCVARRPGSPEAERSNCLSPHEVEGQVRPHARLS